MYDVTRDTHTKTATVWNSITSHTAILVLLLTFCFLNFNILCISGTVCGCVCVCKHVYIDGSSCTDLKSPLCIFLNCSPPFILRQPFIEPEAL